MEWIAHRAGNDAERAAAAAAMDSVAAIEVDVHLFHRRLEVRHARALWPFARQFEPWYLLPRSAPRPSLAEIVAVVPGDTSIWYDLKGFTPRLARQVLAVNGERRPVTLSCRSWWVLRPGRRLSDGGVAGVRTMKSVNNRWQRWLVTRTRLGGTDTGVVINQRLLEPGVLEALRATGAGVVVSWGVDSTERTRELIDAGIDGLIIDDLGLIATT